jgi:hypothetical protein
VTGISAFRFAISNRSTVPVLLASVGTRAGLRSSADTSAAEPPDTATAIGTEAASDTSAEVAGIPVESELAERSSAAATTAESANPAMLIPLEPAGRRLAAGTLPELTVPDSSEPALGRVHVSPRTVAAAVVPELAVGSETADGWAAAMHAAAICPATASASTASGMSALPVVSAADPFVADTLPTRFQQERGPAVTRLVDRMVRRCRESPCRCSLADMQRPATAAAATSVRVAKSVVRRIAVSATQGWPCTERRV